MDAALGKLSSALSCLDMGVGNEAPDTTSDEPETSAESLDDDEQPDPRDIDDATAKVLAGVHNALAAWHNKDGEIMTDALAC
jgi:hypothetical protein